MPIFKSDMKEVSDKIINEVLQQHERVVVKYFADWCGMCRILTPRLARISLDAKYETIHFISLNTEHNPITKRQNKIKALPTVQAFYQGKLIHTTTSIKEDDLSALLDALLKRKVMH